VKVLIIDNYDSFVFNLERYALKLHATTHVYRNDTITLADIENLNPSHIILSPGPCTPNEAGICLDIVKKLTGSIPILGICLGNQVIGQALGGSVVRAKKPMHGKSSAIFHDGTGLFKNLSDPITAGRYHSLVVSRENLPSSLSVCAWSTENEIMALSWEKKALYGLQFHPESVLTETGFKMLQLFLQPSHLP
jgi:para-aminobenzoate synthetase component 2